MCGEAAAYFDAENPCDMAQSIESTILDTAGRKALAEAASRRWNTFSWGRCADQTLQVYRRALTGEVQT